MSGLGSIRCSDPGNSCFWGGNGGCGYCFLGSCMIVLLFILLIVLTEYTYYHAGSRFGCLVPGDFCTFAACMLDRILLIIPLWIVLDLYFFRVLQSALSGFDRHVRRGIGWVYWIYDAGLILALLYLKLTGSGI